MAKYFEVRGYVDSNNFSDCFEVVGIDGDYEHTIESLENRFVVYHTNYFLSCYMNPAYLEVGDLVSMKVVYRMHRDYYRVRNNMHFQEVDLKSINISDYKAVRVCHIQGKLDAPYLYDRGLQTLAAFIDKKSNRFDLKALDSHDSYLYEKFLNLTLVQLKGMIKDARDWKNKSHLKRGADIARFEQAVEYEIVHRISEQWEGFTHV